MKAGKKVLAIATAVSMLTVTAAPAFAASEITKEETVYVVTEADGSQSEVTVSDHLANGSASDKIHDESDLKDIENVKGDETFEQGSGDELVWNAEGNDIFYQGSTDREVPVKVGISYFLNGEEVDGAEMDGASGDVKIVINYRNTATDENGTTVPFLVMSGFICEDDTFTDIDIDHGKVIDDGEKKVVAALAVPGLEDAMDIDKDLVDLDLSDTVTITGTAKDFAVQDIMTLATNSIFEEVDSDDFGDLDYDDQIRELDKGSKALMDGSRQLYQGIDTMYENMPALKKGVNKLNKGSKQLRNGTKEALNGAKALDQGANQLKGSLTQQMTDAVNGTALLEGGAVQVQNGMKQVKAGLDGTESQPGAIDSVDQIKSGIDSAKSGVDSAESGATQLKAPASDVEQYLEDLQTEFNKISASDKEKLEAKGFDVDLIGKIGGKIGEQKAIQSGLNNITAEGALPKVSTGLAAASTGLGQVSDGLTTASAGLGQAIDGQQQVIDGLTDLHDTLAKATGEDGALTQGLQSLVTGTGQLKAGEVQLAGGSKQLASGMQKLADKTGTLAGGVSQLDKGSLKLSQGMSKLYNDGIRKIVDLYNDDLKGTLNDMEDVIDAGQSYKSFTKLPDGMDGNVKFIYKTSIY